MNQEIRCLVLVTKKSLSAGIFLFLMFFVLPLTINKMTNCLTFFENQCPINGLDIVILIFMIPYLFVSALIDGLIPGIFGVTFNIIATGIILYIFFVILCALVDDLISKKQKIKP